MSGAMTVGAVLELICTLHPRERDQEEVRDFVMTLPRDQNEIATDSQIAKARELALCPSPRAN